MIHQSVKIGQFCIIEEGVEIGEGTVIRNYVEIRKGTKIGRNCYIDSRVSFSGQCEIGNDVTLRYGVIIARGVKVGNESYFAPRVMTNNLNTKKISIGGAKVGAKCFIGTHTVLHHGITICDNVSVGANSFVNKTINKPANYVGSPCREV